MQFLSFTSKTRKGKVFFLIIVYLKVMDTFLLMPTSISECVLTLLVYNPIASILAYATATLLLS